VKSEGLRDPDPAAVDEALRRCEPKQAGRHGSLEPVREHLYEVMWDKVGIIRDAKGLEAALSELGAIEAELAASGIADANRAFNLTWHDWMNLRSLVQVSQVITRAALARTDSRGAHFREDFPQAGTLETSAFTSVREVNGRLELAMKPVAFTRVKPGQSLLKNAG